MIGNSFGTRLRNHDLALVAPAPTSEAELGVALQYNWSMSLDTGFRISWDRLLRRNPFMVLNMWRQLLWPKQRHGFYETLVPHRH